MKSEIAWLMEAFLEKDPKQVRIMIKDRMAEVTESLTTPIRQQAPVMQSSPSLDPVLASQSPSMQRIMQQNPELIPKPPVPVTPAAAQALAARAALLSGQQEPGRKSPRKM